MSSTHRPLSVSWFLLLAAGSELAWLLLGSYLVPAIISRGYRGESLGFINHFFAGTSQPLDYFLLQWERTALWGLFLLPLVFVLVRLLTVPSYAPRLVPPATPESLGAIRALTCGILLVSVLWEDLPSTAALPRELVRPMGLVGLLNEAPGFRQFTASEAALGAFQWMTAALLLFAGLGLWTRATTKLAALGYLVFGGLFRQYAWFYHTGLVPLYVLAFLSVTPCGDAWSLDRWRRARRGQVVPPPRQPQTVYGWARYGCWVLIALPYVAAGLSKLRNGGWLWWDATNFRHILYRSVLNPMEFDFDGALHLVSIPDSWVAALALAAVAGEVLFGLVLFSRYARLVLPPFMVLMHAGILFLQNILFFDLILLQLAFVDMPAAWDRCRRRAGGAVQAARTSDGGPVPAEAAEARSGRIRRWVVGWSVGLLLCWMFRLEFYPLTGMQMFSGRETSGVVSYNKVLASFASGETGEIRLERCVGALADGRYRRLLDLAFEPSRQALVAEFFRGCAQRWNQAHASGERIQKFEVQRWVWDFHSEPGGPGYGRLVEQKFYEP